MTGQPTGEFNVTKLEVVETGTSNLNNIVDAGEMFRLKATFEGTGTNWDNMEKMPVTAEVYFYGEGMGLVASQAFGAIKSQVLAYKTGKYEVFSDQVSVPIQGIFRCGCVVTFKNGATPWYGWLGYNEDCVLQVHPSEQP